jgi:putative transposase
MKLLLRLVLNIFWLRIAIENDHREILQINISKERNMFVAERFILNLVKRYGEHPVSTDSGTWYPLACRFLRLHHHIHSPYEKSIIERTVQYIKYRTEGFDDYFLRRKSKCKLQHMQKWFNLFVSHYNNNLFS